MGIESLNMSKPYYLSPMLLFKMPTTFRKKRRFTLREVFTPCPALTALVLAMLAHHTSAPRPSTLIS
jgi:hypothetical protein